MSDLIVLNRSRDFSHWFLIYRGIIGKSHRHIGVLIHVVPTSDHSISTHPMHSCPCAHCSRHKSGRGVAASPFRGDFRSGLRLQLSRGSPMYQAVLSSSFFLIMDWSFASRCSPPRLSATQFPSHGQPVLCPRGLPPHCWCALSGALGEASRFGFENRANWDAFVGLLGNLVPA